MGLFDFFKKKPSNGATQTELEVLLRKAMVDSSFRTEFYKKLLTEDLIIITANVGLPEGDQILQKDTSINIVSLRDGKVPVFTSTDRIFDKGVIKKQVNYLAVKGEDLFNFTEGSTLLLNPYSDFNKELLPNEIQELLSGRIFHGLTGNMTVKKDTRIVIGQPAKYPSEIANALSQLFADEPSVRAAYLGLIKYPDMGEQPRYVFCIDTDGDDKDITEKAGRKVQPYLKSGEFADFVSKDSLGDYFKTVPPFYKK